MTGSEPKEKDLLARLADVGEEAISRLAHAPGVDAVTSRTGHLAERLDELQLRLRGLDRIERRLKELERRVEELERAAAGTTEPEPAAGRPAVKPHPGAEAARREAAPGDEPGAVPGA
jgi:hypothetical protein